MNNYRYQSPLFNTPKDYPMKSNTHLLIAALIFSSLFDASVRGDDSTEKDETRIANRTIVPGVLSLNARFREKTGDGKIVSKTKELK